MIDTAAALAQAETVVAAYIAKHPEIQSDFAQFVADLADPLEGFIDAQIAAAGSRVPLVGGLMSKAMINAVNAQIAADIAALEPKT
jgi:hypothetical protein